jgi:putative ABC transport system permease protein
MQSFLQDVRYGARMLLKNRSFTVIAILAIGLGIGANTAIFSVVNAVLLRPLPYPAPEQLVALYGTDTRKPNDALNKDSISYPDFFDWREQNQSFENIAAYRAIALSLTGGETPIQVSGQVVSAEVFDLLHVKPLLGRTFTREEEKVGGGDTTRAAIISYKFWQKQFGGEISALGRTVMLDRKQYEIVGIMPVGFQFPIQTDAVEVWVPPAVDSVALDGDRPTTERRGFRWLQTIGRLKPGVSLQQAQDEMSLIAGNLAKLHPENNTFNGIKIIPFHTALVSDYHTVLLILFGAVGCVLLIACANVANLLLARTTARYKEIAVRAAMGASRLRIVRQLLTESILLSVCGGVLGLLLAAWGIEVLIKFIPEDVPRLAEINLDLWVLGFTLLISFITGIFFGVAPAIQGSRTDLHEAMKEGARGMTGSRHSRLRNTLVVIEVAIAIVLLVGAGLLGQTFLKLQHVDLGFNRHNLLTASVDLPTSQYLKPEQRIAFFQQLVEKVRAMPGVISASAVLPLPLSGNDANGSFTIEGQPVERGNEPETSFRWTQLDYFNTMKIALLEGRDFTPQDNQKAPPVVIINESFVKQYFANESPIGKHLHLPFSSGEKATTDVQIVGVVNDVRHQTSLSKEAGAEIYMPYAQLPFFHQMSLVLRTSIEPRALAKDLQSTVATLDKDLPLFDVKTADQYLSNAIAQPRFSALLFSLFAAVALFMSSIGLYGVMAYSVTQRTHEIGIRMALGAQVRDVLKMVVRQGMFLAVIGIVLGLIAAFVLTRLLTTLLYQISSTDPITFIFVSVILLGVALTACIVPARRAARTNPLEALRYE